MRSTSALLSTAIYIQLSIIIHSVLIVQGQRTFCSPNETETFDKVTGVDFGPAVQRAQLFSSNGFPITADCNNRCRTSSNCTGFLLNYETESCSRVISNSPSSELRSQIRASPRKVNYFEKVCLKAYLCPRAWIYERVPGYELAGYDDRVLSRVSSRTECQDICLEDVELPCRSAEYDYTRKECRLSKETRRTQPAAYRASIDDMEYLENQCADDPQDRVTCDYQEYENQDLGFPDLLIQGVTKEECQRRCNTNSAFVCRSFTYFPVENICKLSSDDNLSAGPTALRPKQGANYYQKAPCVDLTLVCGAKSMTVTLTTDEGFGGKLYAFKNPRGCQARGTGRTETALTFLYEEEEQDEAYARCGVEREADGIFSNTVVIQNHPIIQQKGDRAIKIYCYFETGEKTVTNSYDVLADTIPPEETDDEDVTEVPGLPTSVVNSTAPSPQVVLRITDSQGNDISGTRLGEDLYLRIELDGDSIFDIFARNLVAQSGVDDETIVLLDDRGCPADPVFPGLQKEAGSGALLGRFEAFKFSETTVVNFEVNVQFCQDACNPVDCGNGIRSFGKRRRRRDADAKLGALGERLVYDPNLGQEVIALDTPLRKQIFVDPGITVNRFTADPLGSGDDSRSGQGRSLSGATGGQGVFVEGDFSEGEVVCTTWTWVWIGVTCIIFLVFSILVVCVLCIYTSRKTAQFKDRQDSSVDYATSSRQSMVGMGGPRSATPLYQSHLSLRSPTPSGHFTSSGAAGSTSAATDQNNAFKSLRTTLRD